MQRLIIASRIAVAAASVAALSSAMSAPAAAYPKSVVRACKADYQSLCPGYKLHSAALKACMRAQHGAISRRCINALVDAGEAPPKARRP